MHTHNQDANDSTDRRLCTKKEKEKWQTIGRHAKHTNTLCKYQEI